MKLKRSTLALPFLTALTFIGCEGNPGAPGQNRLPEDRYPPSVEIILPLASKPLYAQSVVEAIMVDDDTVARYEFLVDGMERNALFSVRRAPFLFTWDASSLAPGRHTLQLRVWDPEGKTTNSALLYLLRSDEQSPARDTLRYYTDSTRMVATEWKLPADSMGSFAGLGVRFTPDRACVLKQIGIKLHRKASWKRGATLMFDVYSETNGLPDSLRFRKQYALRGADEEYNDWVPTHIRSVVALEGEFFVVVTLAEAGVGDTTAIQSDDGGWANGHGLVKTLDGEWQTFNVGRGRKPNPLIYAVVEY